MKIKKFNEGKKKLNKMFDKLDSFIGKQLET